MPEWGPTRSPTNSSAVSHDTIPLRVNVHSEHWTDSNESGHSNQMAEAGGFAGFLLPIKVRDLAYTTTAGSQNGASPSFCRDDFVQVSIRASTKIIPPCV